MKGLLAKKNVTVNELGGKDITNGYDFFSAAFLSLLTSYGSNSSSLSSSIPIFVNEDESVEK